MTKDLHSKTFVKEKMENEDIVSHIRCHTTSLFIGTEESPNHIISKKRSEYEIDN